jgi:DNA-binding IclR family transcriptional regulator
LILHVLAQHPAGLTPGAVASQLGLTTSLTATLQAMTREGLLRRISAEVYAVAENP